MDLGRRGAPRPRDARGQLEPSKLFPKASGPRGDLGTRPPGEGRRRPWKPQLCPVLLPQTGKTAPASSGQLRRASKAEAGRTLPSCLLPARAPGPGERGKGRAGRAGRARRAGSPGHSPHRDPSGFRGTRNTLPSPGEVALPLRTWRGPRAYSKPGPLCGWLPGPTQWPGPLLPLCQSGEPWLLWACCHPGARCPGPC